MPSKTPKDNHRNIMRRPKSRPTRWAIKFYFTILRSNRISAQNSNLNFGDPFQIISELPHFQYTVKDLSTAKILKKNSGACRPHATIQSTGGSNRRPGPISGICLFEGQTQARNLDVKVVIADATTLECDALKFTCSIKTVAKTRMR
jgi:hypothetical protein